MSDHLVSDVSYDYPKVVEAVSKSLARSREWIQLADILTLQVPLLMQLTGAQLKAGDLQTGPLDVNLQPQLRFPLKLDGNVHGVWILGPRKDCQNFTAIDRRILQTLSCLAEIALENIILFKELHLQMENLSANRELLTQVERQLLRTQEKERASLARELHDGPIQTLVGINLQLGMLSSLAFTPTNYEKILDSVHAARIEVLDLVSELRQTCIDLHPPMLETLGLGAALRALALDWSTKFQIPIHILLVEDTVHQAIPYEIAVNLFRIAQEALSNIAQHASAQHVNLTLAGEIDPLRLKLSIQDDGRGFEPAAAWDSAEGGHFGLISMQERVALIGGQWNLDSIAGVGTTIQIHWQGSAPESLGSETHPMRWSR